MSERSGGVGRTVGGLGRRRSRDEPESDRYEDEELDQYDESDQCEKEPAEDGVDEELEPEEGEDTEQYDEYAREDEAGVVRQTRSAPA